ncbi:MAG: DUF3850 domain-containing protein [Alicyclobacillus sp.]|nr:DUF3850 domain-containing protein [Alicyclobacillus sp.]
MGTTHELKCWPEYFEPLLKGEKTVELRRDDRGFQVGDMLFLREYDPVSERYTGRTCTRIITHVLRGGPWLADGYVALSLANGRMGEVDGDAANTAHNSSETS